MKIKKQIVVASVVGLLSGVALCRCTPDLKTANASVSCDEMEQTRLEVALQQCDDAVQFLVWGDSGQ